MATDDEIMEEHKNHMGNPKAKNGENQLYNQDCVKVMLDDARAEGRTDQFHRDIDEVVSIKDAKADTAKQIFAVLDNLHIVENWSTQKGKGIPLLLKQIGAYKDVKKKFGVLK